MPHTAEDGLTWLPTPSAWTLEDGSGITAARDSLIAGLTALTEGLKADDAPAPTPFHYLLEHLNDLRQHQEPQTSAWRGLLALCLLTDVWTDGPALCVRTVDEQAGTLAKALLADMPLRLIFLAKADCRCLVGVASREAGVIPAADADDVAPLLPDRVTWYDRASGRFTDPSSLLNEHDRAVLIRRLTVLGSHAVPPVADFLADLIREGLKSAQEAARQDEDALRALVIRVKAVAGLAPEKALAGLSAHTDGYQPSAANPLLTSLSIVAPEEQPPHSPQTTWLWHGAAFARSCAALGLEASGMPGEAAALEHLAAELDLLTAFSPRWRQALGPRLSEWLIAHGGTALSPAARNAVEEAKRQAAAFVPDDGARLVWPFRYKDGAESLIGRECLDGRWAAALASPFADRLCLLPAGSLGDAVLSQTCALSATPEAPAFAVLPPLSAAMAQCVPGGAELRAESFVFAAEADGGVRASVTLYGERPLTLTRVYAPGEILRLSAEAVPTLAVWPAVPFMDDAWRAYYAYIHGGSLQIGVLRQGEWALTEDRVFSVLETERFPAAMLVRQDSLTLGAVLNLLPPFAPDRAEPVMAGLEVGSTGTAVALRQGLRTEAMQLPALVRTLLLGGKSAPLAEEFLPAQPIGPVLSSAAELFTREGDAPLTDGHILPCAVESAADKTIAYSLKWGTDKPASQARRMYLHQLMMTASLSAALTGAPSITWRLALPEDMTEQGRRSLFQAVTELAPAVAAHTGLPLTPGAAPVVHGDASMALGAYHRRDGGIRGGFLSMDWGSGNLALALWLRGMNRPAVRCCLPLGFQSLLAELSPDALRRDFDSLADPAARRCVMLLADQLAASRGNRSAFDKARYLLDASLGEHLPALAAHMNAQYAAGQITDLQARLTVLAATALTITGMIQEQTWRDPLLNDYLPANMTLALAGRGSLLLAALPEALQARLTRFIRLMMSADHPVHDLRIAPSAAPKAETVLGLLRMTDVSDALPGKAVPLRANAPLPLPPEGLMMRFLSALHYELPEACAAVYPGLFETDGRLTVDAAAMLRAGASRHFTADASPEAAFAACLAELRALP